MPGRNLVVTGLPRSGTTLLAALMDSCASSVCLSEPSLPCASTGVTCADYAARLHDDFQVFRARIAAGEAVADLRSATGERVTNYLSSADRSDDRTMIAEQVAAVRSGMSPDFTLAVKQNGPFLAALHEIVATGAYQCVGLVRHPRDVLRSWFNSTVFPIGSGRLPAAEKRWPEFAAITQGAMTLPEKMAHIYETLVERLVTSRLFALLRYEEVIRDPGATMRRLDLVDGELGLVARRGDGGATTPDCERALVVLASLRGAAVQVYRW